MKGRLTLRKTNERWSWKEKWCRIKIFSKGWVESHLPAAGGETYVVLYGHLIIIGFKTLNNIPMKLGDISLRHSLTLRAVGQTIIQDILPLTQSFHGFIQGPFWSNNYSSSSVIKVLILKTLNQKLPIKIKIKAPPDLHYQWSSWMAVDGPKSTFRTTYDIFNSNNYSFIIKKQICKLFRCLANILNNSPMAIQILRHFNTQAQ